MAQTFHKMFEESDKDDLDYKISEWLDENQDINIVSSSLSEYWEGDGYMITQSVFFTFETNHKL